MSGGSFGTGGDVALFGWPGVRCAPDALFEGCAISEVAEGVAVAASGAADGDSGGGAGSDDGRGGGAVDAAVAASAVAEGFSAGSALGRAIGSVAIGAWPRASSASRSAASRAERFITTMLTSAATTMSAPSGATKWGSFARGDGERARAPVIPVSPLVRGSRCALS